MTPTAVYLGPIMKKGEVSGLRGIAIDLTEIKEAQAALIKAKEAWENTFDAISDPIMILDNNRCILRQTRLFCSDWACPKTRRSGRTEPGTGHTADCSLCRQRPGSG